jgi:hypothetical protein
MDLGMLIVTVIAASISAFAVAVNMWLYRTQTDPEVIVFVTPDESEETQIWIVVQNVGKGLATDIRFTWRNAAPVKAYGMTAEEAAAETPKPLAGPLLRGISSLGPGSRRVFIWGQHAGITAALAPHDGELRVGCEYYGGHRFLLGDRRLHRREYVLDVRSFDETIDRDAPLRQIHRTLEDIEKRLASLPALAQKLAILMQKSNTPPPAKSV